MPHKHKRKRGQEDKSHFNLPPTANAKPLSVYSKPTIEILDNSNKIKKTSNKRRKANREASGNGKKTVDDTPKQFARLMAWRNEGKRLRKGLDDGVRQPKEERKTKKPAGGADTRKERAGTTDSKNLRGPKPEKKTTAALATASQDNDAKARPLDENPQPSESSTTSLKILPGERLSDFSLRVDQSLPLSSVPRHTTKEPLKIPGLKSQQNLTKHTKKLLRLQSQWREEEQRRKEKRDELDEDMGDKREEEGLLWGGVEGEKFAKKGKRKKGLEVGEGDIWKVLQRKKEEGRGLNAGESVKEPPKLGRVKNMFKEPKGGVS